MFRKLILIGALFAGLLPAGGFASPTRAAESELASIGGSGITAEIEFVDTGTALRATGEAQGLDPSKTYVSLIYDNGSVATGPRACEPTIGPGQPGHLTDAQMFVGFWVPKGSTERTLSASPDTSVPVVKTGSAYAKVGTFRTVSVRELVTFGPPPVAPLRACGVVVAEDES